MGAAEYIAIAGVGATLIGVFITWYVMKKQYTSKKLTYSYSIDAIVKNNDPKLARDLKVSYQGKDITHPALLNLKIVNSGLVAIEDAEIIIHLPGATYLIPGYFEDIPAGYEALWNIQKIDEEHCKVQFKHINPKQIAEICLLMNESQKKKLIVSCPMPNVECVEGNILNINNFVDALQFLVEVGFLPNYLRSNRWK
ncbi:hypothetical protein OHV64_09935 [Acinetobacter baumannii]|uniref:hypothetical protein n=1 Tax=Acinetobacter baumannii TaxID=470 RepID=UPI002341E577|nr:hypothetical protein [Acinetobacter baumannii]